MSEVEQTPAETELPTPRAGRFARHQHAFAADQEPIREPFEMMGHQCYVVLRPMDADADSRYRALLQDLRFSVDEDARQAAKSGEAVEARIVQQTGQLEMVLLCGTVIDFLLPQRKGNSVRLVVGNSLNEREREQTFRKMDAGFRRDLVDFCLEVNHLDPKPFGGERPTGTETSESS